MHRRRPCLQNIELAAAPVLAPFEVHGHGMPCALRIVLFDAYRPACELEHFALGEHELQPALRGDSSLRYALSAALCIDELHCLVPALAAHDRTKAGGQR